LKLALRLLLSLAVAVALLALLMAWGDVRPEQLLDAARTLPASTFALALGVHLAIYLLRAARFSALLPAADRPPFPGVLAASAAHNLAAYVLPAKTGEATLVVYLRSHSGVAASAGLATLLLSRLLDLATLCLLVAGASLALRGTFSGEFAALVPWLAAGLLALSAVLGAACLRPDLLPRAAAAAARGLGLGQTRIGTLLLAKVGSLAGALRRSASPAGLLLASLLSFALWGLVFLFYAVLGRGVGLPAELGFLHTVFGASLAVLFNLLPINGFAGFGTQEAGWKVGFVLVGVEPALALSTGFAVHLAQLANVVLLGLLGHLALPLLGRARTPRRSPQ
jgi:uncharacterized membrane protein YbhN (UPF0104 family)